MNFERVAEIREEFRKAKSHKYYKRVRSRDGKWRYYYSEAQYKRDTGRTGKDEPKTQFRLAEAQRLYSMAVKDPSKKKQSLKELNEFVDLYSTSKQTSYFGTPTKDILKEYKLAVKAVEKIEPKKKSDNKKETKTKEVQFQKVKNGVNVTVSASKGDIKDTLTEDGYSYTAADLQTDAEEKYGTDLLLVDAEKKGDKIKLYFQTDTIPEKKETPSLKQLKKYIDLSDRSNPNKKQQQKAEQALIDVGFYDEDGTIPTKFKKNAELNKKLKKYFEESL